MTIIFLILPITLLLSLSAVAAFAWATRGGQFDDLQTPALRALHDPTAAPPSPEAARSTAAAAARLATK
ncbi:MAG TPA: cbb3-type cytochrome oxidase assembly protein CcoS [Polyangiaceae bacterium]|nr:cbb3-type cytochrome oxidase assembly protein CcoS [Polyangiaceae bacterium]